MAKRMHRQEGFTLIELMIVILIIGILVGIAVPVFLAARGSASQKACLANQRNFMSAADIFAAENDGYPYGTEASTKTGKSGLFPDKYYEGKLTSGGAPECPSSNTVAVTYGNGKEVRPTTNCTGDQNHGSPKD